MLFYPAIGAFAVQICYTNKFLMIDFNEDFIILFYATKLLTKIQLVLALNYHEVVGWIAWIPLTAPFVSPF
jgi:hypothetical protein